MMPMLTASTLNSHPATDSARKHKDGTVLLSTAEDRICKLNGVGALTWMTLEDIRHSASLDRVVSALEDRFESINAEGELRYEVPREQLRSDTACFLRKLAAMALLRIEKDVDGEELYSIEDDVSSTTSAPRSNDLQRVKVDNEDPPTNIQFSKRETFSAFLGLLAFDLLLKIAGFQALIKKVERWPTARPRTTDREVCRRVRGMVDRAQMYYPKKAMCLQHSAVVTCLLRRRGVPAEMILAAQEFPPKAHAWAEVLNEVVSDSPSVKTKYRELRRL
jgi:transglutaminase superfamily protein/coenzyme PQQ synthesis protein D (PqqD)